MWLSGVDILLGYDHRTSNFKSNNGHTLIILFVNKAIYESIVNRRAFLDLVNKIALNSLISHQPSRSAIHIWINCVKRKPYFTYEQSYMLYHSNWSKIFACSLLILIYVHVIWVGFIIPKYTTNTIQIRFYWFRIQVPFFRLYKFQSATRQIVLSNKL